MGYSPIKMTIFQSYVSLPEGSTHCIFQYRAINPILGTDINLPVISVVLLIGYQ